MRSTKTVILAILAVLVMFPFGEASAQKRKKEKFYPDAPAVVDPVEYAAQSGGEVLLPKDEIDWSKVNPDTLSLFEFVRPDTPPRFRGDDKAMFAFRDHVQRCLTLPKSFMKEINRQPDKFIRLLVRFIVETDGSVRVVECLRGATPESNVEMVEAVTKLVRSKDDWTPASHNGRKVRYKLTLPIDCYTAGPVYREVPFGLNTRTKRRF